MRAFAFRSGVVLLVISWASTASAQGFGLDLTSDGPDFRPSLAFLGVTSPPSEAEQAFAAAEAVEQLAKGSGKFVRVVTPSELQTLLGDDYGDALQCKEPGCLTSIAHKLGVDRLVSAELGEGGLRVTGFDWGSGLLETVTVAPRLLKGAGAQKRVQPFITPLLDKLGALLGKLEVATNVDGAEVRWGGRLVGTGKSASSVVPAGTHPLTVTAEGYVTHTEDVTIDPAGTKKIETTLAEAPKAPAPVAEVAEPAPAPTGKPLWQRPGVYVAAAGVAVLGVGLGMGASARGVANRMQDADNDGALDVTRREALTAQRNAAVANVLGAVGLALAGGGAAWTFFDKGSDAGGASASITPTGTGVLVHGSF